MFNSCETVLPGEHADNHRDRAADKQGDVVPPADTSLSKFECQLVGLLVEFAVRDRLPEMLDGDRVGLTKCPRLEGVMNEIERRVFPRALTVAFE